MGGGGRIERHPVVLNGDLERPVLACTSDMDVVLIVILKAVVDDVRKQFVQCQVDLEGLPFGDTTVLAKLPEMVTENIQFRQAVF
jgi:hypothetical protein